MTQSQSGGMGSTNTQIGTVNIGLGYNDVKAIAKDVFDDNFNRLADHAKSIAESRAEIIREEIISELSSQKDARLDSFAEPEKQVALLEAQKSYALCGDDELKGMLVRTVVEISKQPERSLKSIVLQEALKVLPHLTSRQMKAIALAFAMRHVRWVQKNDLNSHCELFLSLLGGSAASFDVTDGDFRHIQYCRCGNVEVTSATFATLMKGIYPGFVAKGMTQPEIDEAFRSVGVPPGCLIPALFDNSKIQIAAIDNGVLEEKASHFGWTNEQFNIAKRLLASNALDENEIDSLVSASNNACTKLKNLWDGTKLKNLSLTSVGMAVGHSYIVGSGNPVADLGAWL